MAAVVLRRASSFGSPSSYFRHLHNRLFTTRFLPFSTSSASCPPPETSVFREPKQTASEITFPDWLPFDYMVVDPEHEYMCLRRKTKDEIIEVAVRSYAEHDDDEIDYRFVRDYANSYDDFGSDDEQMMNGEKIESKKEEFEESNENEVNEEDKKSNEVIHDNHEMVNQEKNEPIEEECHESKEQESDEVDYTDDDGEMIDEEEDYEIPRLTLLVTILYGDNFNRCLKFLGRAYPDNHNKLRIRDVSIRKSRKRGEPIGPSHLDEFENFFKKRGIEASNFNFLFNYLDKKDQLKENTCGF